MVSPASADAIRKPLNAGTTLLIRKRCEAAVRSALLRWGGLPVGGTSAAAFVLALLVWIPQQLDNLNLTGLAQDALRDHVENAVASHGAMREKLNAIVAHSVETQAKEVVTAQLGTAVQEPIEKALATRVESVVSGQVELILKSQGMKATMGEVVAANLRSGDHKVLISAIQPKLNAIAAVLSQSVAQNSEMIVQQVSLPLPEHLQINKSNYEDLRKALDILRGMGPTTDEFALRFYAAAGMAQDNQYESDMIRDYLQQLGGVLGKQLRFVVVLDAASRFMALTEIDDLDGLSDGELEEFTEALNNSKHSKGQVLDQIGSLFGPAAVVHFEASTKLRDVFRDPVWQTVGSRHHVAVLNEDGSFDGLTTRDRMLSALLPR